MQIAAIFLSLFVSVSAINWSTYPSVPKTATYNGFADPLFDKLPQCAKDCVTLSTRSTPCPYWDTGCLCVVPTWSGLVAQCFAQSCRGLEIAIATSLAYSLCERVGANVWNMPASVSTQLSSAAESVHIAAATTKKSPWSNSKTLSSVLKTAKTEDKTLTAPASSTASSSSSKGSSSSSNGAVGASAGVALVLMFLGLLA